MRLLARSVLAAAATLALMSGPAGCGRGSTADDGSEDPKRTGPDHFSMTLNETRLRPGEEFSVTYHVDDPSVVIEHGQHLELSRDGKEVNVLYNLEYSESYGGAVRPPDPLAQTPATVGPGPIRFVLPKQLDPGSYRLCGGANAAPEGEIRRLDGEETCVDITVSG